MNMSLIDGPPFTAPGRGWVVRWELSRRVYASGVYIHRQQVKDQRELNRDWRVRRFPETTTPCKPITTFQAQSVDRLHSRSVREPRFPSIRYTWGRSVGATSPRELLSLSRDPQRCTSVSRPATLSLPKYCCTVSQAVAWRKFARFGSIPAKYVLPTGDFL
jgi:hypothetical protein